jgi:hypothetical protein
MFRYSLSLQETHRRQMQNIQDALENFQQQLKQLKETEASGTSAAADPTKTSRKKTKKQRQQPTMTNETVAASRLVFLMSHGPMAMAMDNALIAIKRDSGSR